MLAWFLACTAAAAYCLVRSVTDFRAERYVWGAFGLASAAIILAVPVQTHAVRVTLPQSSN